MSLILKPQIYRRESSTTVPVRQVHETALTADILDYLLVDVPNGLIGIAPGFRENCSLASLSIATPKQVLHVTFSTEEKRKRKGKRIVNHLNGRRLLEQKLLVNNDFIACTLRGEQLACSLYLDLGVRISNCIDMLSISLAACDRDSNKALFEALGGEDNIWRGHVLRLFGSYKPSIEEVATQAWAMLIATGFHTCALPKQYKINTVALSISQLEYLATIQRIGDRSVALKPTRTKNEIQPQFSIKRGQYFVISKRYKTRLVTSPSQYVEITADTGKNFVGRVSGHKGREARLAFTQNFSGNTIKNCVTVGRDRLIQAEVQRREIVLASLKRTISTFEIPFVKSLWFPSSKINWRYTDTPYGSPVPIHSPTKDLNKSQTNAVNVILSNDDKDRVAIIHGPPGTGKTTVIAASVASIMFSSCNSTQTVWLIAQSNVAVKNIAEKLAAVGFWDFKILVSKEFHFDWHEHLYTQIEDNLIRSDRYTSDAIEMSRLILGSKVLLCTLSTLSDDKISTIFRIVPVQTVIVDEASQIEIGNYLPLLYRFQRSLRKLVFIGDDKQLPPYGQTDIPEIKSVFELPHLRKGALMLETQYRMPVPIGTFISKRVYENRLKSNHDITSSKCCRFVDVPASMEERKGSSFINIREARMVLVIAKELDSQNKSYRIITPYDAQRSFLESECKTTKLPWEDKFFNVDAFQGNEDDYIIISLVRSKTIGFLKDGRRMNVMLTRCKQGMVICSSRSFIESKARDTLVGQLSSELGKAAWMNGKDVLNSRATVFS